MVYAALVGNVLVALAKFAASSISGSSAMLTEAIHSSTDTVNQILLLIGNKRSRARADASHAFGYGMGRGEGSVVALRSKSSSSRCTARSPPST